MFTLLGQTLVLLVLVRRVDGIYQVDKASLYLSFTASLVDTSFSIFSGSSEKLQHCIYPGVTTGTDLVLRMNSTDGCDRIVIRGCVCSGLSKGYAYACYWCYKTEISESVGSFVCTHYSYTCLSKPYGLSGYYIT